MKKLSLLLLFAIVFLFSSFDVKDAVFYRKEHYQKETWYPMMISKLTKEDRADVHSAQWIRMLSSNSFIAFEKDQKKLIEKLGKVSEQEIRVLFKETEKDPQLYIFVETTYGILDLFIFNTNTSELKRVNNKGYIVMHFGDRISLKENNKEGLLFYNEYDSDGAGRLFRNHIYFNRSEYTLAQIKNCEIVRGVEQCKETK